MVMLTPINQKSSTSQLVNFVITTFWHAKHGLKLHAMTKAKALVLVDPVFLGNKLLNAGGIKPIVENRLHVNSCPLTSKHEGEVKNHQIKGQMVQFEKNTNRSR